MKYLLFEKSAVELLINDTELQSLEFEVGASFIAFLKEERESISLDSIAIKKTKEGIIFVGDSLSKTFVLIDMKRSQIIERVSDGNLLTILQKLFRFCIRYWMNMGFTANERVYKTKASIYPFPFSANEDYHLVLWRDPKTPRLDKRGISQSVFVYNYDNDNTIAVEKLRDPDLGIYYYGGEEYLNAMPEFRNLLEDIRKEKFFIKQMTTPINMIESDSVSQMIEFRYLPINKQMRKLTVSQKKVVWNEGVTSPIRVEGPAGTGKTASLILRAIRLLQLADEKKEKFHVAFFTHSKSTEAIVKKLFSQLSDGKWLNPSGSRYINITTLLDYCANYTGISSNQMVDQDAAEAKQSQLYLIQEAFNKAQDEFFSTYKYYMSERTKEFFINENPIKTVMMLQHEFSVRIKGIAETELDRYKKLKPLESGIPLETEDDKEYIYRIFKLYQESLELLSVYDTDDVILEALARLNAPLWRRNRGKNGFDYLFVDEMHLFNLNEQHIFHYLPRDVDQKAIPICFALDYSQAIGERGDKTDNYFEKEMMTQNVCLQEYSTVFRSSRQITELCASITASGAMLFHNFVNPYKICQSSFTAKEEELCSIPKLLMYKNDRSMVASLHKHIRRLINRYKCQPCEIAVVSFDDEIMELLQNMRCLGGFEVDIILSKNVSEQNGYRRKVTVSLPEYINGLEFKAVILLGIDNGRVPQRGIVDISQSFLRYNALNKLYLSCSRAQYAILMLGSQINGVSECLQHSIANGTLEMENINE